MDKGICFYFGFANEIEERAKMIKDAGFNCVITSNDKKFNHQNGTLEKEVNIFKKYGLKPSTLHMAYDNNDLPYFFLKGFRGNKMERRLSNEVRLAKKYGFSCVIVHLGGLPSDVGVERLKRVLKVCHEQDTPIAIENLDYNDTFFDVFKKIDDPYLKFCWDIGHNNCFSHGFDFIKEYGDKLIALHIHDNDGVHDLHTLNQFGTINWKKVAKQLASLDRDISLDYEIRVSPMAEKDEESFLKIVYEQACELENLIKKERAKIK